MTGKVFFFFFNDTATTEIYTLSLHDALPIFRGRRRLVDDVQRAGALAIESEVLRAGHRDRKSTRLNSSHGYISYAVFCLKKKKTKRLSPSSRAAQTVRTIMLNDIISATHRPH